MGCATSKPKQRLCRNCQAPCSPTLQRRSTGPGDGGGCHVVSLTSSSLESLRSESFHRITPIDDAEDGIGDGKRVEFLVGLVEAKTWSKMIDERLPKIVPRTPIRTPPGEPETINAWELMEGLEDISPLRPANYLRSFSFHGGSNLIRDEIGEAGEIFSKPMWLELADNETSSKSLEFDPNIISTFRKALCDEENIVGISPIDEVLKTEENRGKFENKPNLDEKNSFEIVVNDGNLETDGNRGVSETGGKTDFKISSEVVNEERSSPKPEQKVKNKVVLYFTSLRGVRKTYEDCCLAKLIMKSIGVRIDERDVSMHSGFKEELKVLLGDSFGSSPLPMVFLGENYLGGVDEIRQMHEEGRLERMLLESGEVVPDGGVGVGVCEACGDVRFMPCERCSGSCKIYHGDDFDSDFDDECDIGFRRCPNCNENGLVRCPICCD